MKLTYYRFPETMSMREVYKAWWPAGEPIPEDITEKQLEENIGRTHECRVRTAKEYLKKYGGVAFTEHYDRDGGLFETTEIHLKGNNSKVQYNHHL